MKKNLFIYASLVLLTCLTSKITAQGSWTAVTNLAPHPNVGGFMVLSDGSVLCKTASGGSPANDGNLWDRLKPDINGSYINGTWSTIAAMARTRVFFSSQMLMDGRVYVAGGEYGTDGFQNGNHGEVYDPVTNVWHQSGLPGHIISDGNSEILPDGRVLQSTIDGGFPKATIIYNPPDSSYSATDSSIGGQNESAWLKLPDNSILYVDEGAQTSERYIPSTGQWLADSNVPVSLYQANTLETGPCFLLPNGHAIFFGCPHTALYTPSGNTNAGSWVAGPDIPNGRVMDDAPGAMMPNGNILIAVDSVSENPPTRFYEYNYLTNSFTPVGAPGGGTTLGTISTFQTTMVVLPSGQVLFGIGQDGSASNQYYIYTPGGSPLAAGKPTIANITQTGCTSFTITGTLFNGISEGAGYGDDFQMASNYPIIRLTSGSNVYYARTFNWNSTGVQRGTAADTAHFTLPSGLPVGTYSLVVTANGISSDPFTFIPFPTATAVSNSPICVGHNLNLSSSGGSSYSWTGPNSFSSTAQNPSITNATIAAAGTYTVTVTNAGGCTATATTLVTVNANPTASASSNTPVCAGHNLNLSSSGGTSYSWSGPNSFASTAQNPSVTNATIAATGTYTVTVTNASGCTATATASATVNANPTPSPSSNTPVCAGHNLNLSSSGGTSYSWNGPNSFASTSQNPVIVSATVAATGTYTVTVTNASGCSATATTAATVNANPTASASSNTPVCANSNLNLSSSGGTSYSWSGPNSFASTSQNPVIPAATIAATGTYTVTVTNASGCTATATTAATVNANPVASASNNSPVCANSNLNLSSSGGTFYSWNGPNSFTSTSQNPTIVNSSTSATGTYTVTVTNANSCSASATTSATVNARPAATAGSNTPQCAGSTINLSSSGGSSYSWSGPNSFSSSSQNASIVNATTSATGTYIVTVTNSNNCTATATTSVTVNANPVATASSNSPVCTGSAINLSGSGGTIYAWTGPSSFNSTNQNPSLSSATSANSGTYSLIVIDNNGCTGSASTTVTVSNCSGAILNLTAFLQGFYVSTNTMRATLYNLSLSTDPTATDTITINLWLPTHLSNMFPDYSIKTILHKNGTTTAAYSAAVIGNSYYIAIKHRNTIETWSSGPVPFAASTSYNFSSAVIQAYSNGINTPMHNMGDGVYAFFSGDANQDGTVDASDMAITDNDASHFAYGYNASDCTGDGSTGASDFSVVDNNAQLGLFYARP